MEEEEAGIPHCPESEAHDDDVTVEASRGDQGEMLTEADAVSTLSDKKQREICSSKKNHMLDDPLFPRLRMPVVLRFRRESQDPATDVQRAPAQLGDAHALCEFCGQPARPFPDLADLSIAVEPERFCCLEAQNLVEALAREWRLLMETLGQGFDGGPNPPCTPSKEEELNIKAWENEEHRQQERDLEQYFQATHPPIVPSDSSTRTISFQLSSCVPREVDTSAPQDSGKAEDLDCREENFLTGPGVFGFGIAHHKHNVGFKEKYYANGNKFLTVFPDGSAQVFYPSGKLALLITVGDSKAEMVCIVHDDHAPNPPIRALFQSNGRATCYHKNGNIWVNMDVLGGQCSDERGARVRRWRWGGYLDTPTPLRPLFLSLNHSVGVRVLGQDRMFVTFLTQGCQARFSVGTCVQFKDAGSTVPPSTHSIPREEVFLLAGRMRLHRTLRLLQHCLRLSSCPRPPASRPSPSCVSLARALLSLSQRTEMEESDRAFIRTCLQHCM